ACLLIYDIPTGSRIPNPSPRLWRVAVRINLSCWLVLEENIPYALLNGMSERGASWHVVKFAGDEAGKLLGMATEALRKEVADAVEEAGGDVAAARAAFDPEVTPCEEPCHDDGDAGDDDGDEPRLLEMRRLAQPAGAARLRLETALPALPTPDLDAG